MLISFYKSALLPTSKCTGGSDSIEYACNVGDLGSVPGLGRSPGGGHGNPLQCSYLENSMDRGAWWVTVHEGRKELDRAERLGTAQLHRQYNYMGWGAKLRN